MDSISMSQSTINVTASMAGITDSQVHCKTEDSGEGDSNPSPESEESLIEEVPADDELEVHARAQPLSPAPFLVGEIPPHAQEEQQAALAKSLAKAQEESNEEDDEDDDEDGDEEVSGGEEDSEDDESFSLKPKSDAVSSSFPDLLPNSNN
eukprot:gb/GEZN01021149.1/.p1 GENE.gb/GEZN01021149.1/~~gb/GEZN01021149.1/.p1  ORF type:complete len:171 (+),score=63.10 gb/GEZN01021149.1/:62-514(+)